MAVGADDGTFLWGTLLPALIAGERQRRYVDIEHGIVADAVLTKGVEGGANQLRFDAAHGAYLDGDPGNALGAVLGGELLALLHQGADDRILVHQQILGNSSPCGRSK